MGFIGLRNGLFRVVKWAISGHERAFFGSQKRLFCKIVTGRRNYDGALVAFSSCEMGFSVCLVFTDDMLNVMRPIVNYNKTACFLLVLRQCPYVIYFPFFGRMSIHCLASDFLLRRLRGRVWNHNVPRYRWLVMQENAIKYNNRDMDETGTAGYYQQNVRPFE